MSTSTTGQVPHTGTGSPRLDGALDRLPEPHRAALAPRLRSLAAALDRPVDDTRQPLPALVQEVLTHLPEDRATAWLTASVVAMRLPTQHEVLQVARAGVLDGPAAALAAALDLIDAGRSPRPLRVVRGVVLVDVNNTSKTTFFTGIQRVARECVRAWVGRHDGVLPIGWSPDLLCPAELSPARVERLLAVEAPSRDGGAPQDDPDEGTLLVPWECRYLIPELAAERPRTDRLLAMAAFTGTRVGAIGFDLVPLTSAETVIHGLPNEFAGHLAAARHFERIATISDAACDEYRGWRTMISGAGHTGPDIAAVGLAAEAHTPSPDELDRARERLLIADLPLVLCVGSHEPRKNHLAVLHAAEVLWRRGLRFALTFIGGNAWNSEEFTTTIATLQEAGRPVETVAGIDDATLWAAYRLARFTVFPSFNEGFGLPVAESLMSGTPVVTSGHGSTREIAEAGGGVLLVDPRDDFAVTEAMASLLTDDVVLAALSAEAARRTPRTWEAYAADVWDYLVEGEAPARV